MKKPHDISAADFLPERQTIPALRKAAQHCKGCHLYKNAIQTVFGEGTKTAPLMMVEEIPGKKEDEIGKPFVGPAGTLLRNTLEEAGLKEEDIYFTNAVKHFKFALINNKKMHRSPIGAEIKACKPWLEAELNVIQPQLIVCLGLIAANAITEQHLKLTEQRGKILAHPTGAKILITFHPSAILRNINESDRHKMKRIFLNDLRKAATILK